MHESGSVREGVFGDLQVARSRPQGIAALSWRHTGHKYFSVVPQAPTGDRMPILIITAASSKKSMLRSSTIAHFSPYKYSIRKEVVECNRHHGFLGQTVPIAFYNVYRSRLVSCFDFLNASAFVFEGLTSNTKVWTRRWPHTLVD